MPASGTLRSLQGQSAAKKRWGSADHDTVARDYAAERLAAYIKRTVDSAPPLSPEQRDRLTALLTGGGQLAG